MIIDIRYPQYNRLPYISFKPKNSLDHFLSFPEDHFKKNRQRPLTPLMIRTLLMACEKQSKGLSFGPQDIKGSVMTLINRGLIATRSVTREGKNEEAWYVTPQAITMLTALGVKFSC